MSLVLAVEPDTKQAEILRRILGRQGDPEVIVVTSAYAATSMMRRRVPDLVLLGASLGSKAQEVVDIFCLVSTAPNPQTLGIPRLRAPDANSWGPWAQPRKLHGAVDPIDPEVFAAEVAACLARATEQRQQRNRPEAILPAADTHSPVAEDPAPADAPVAESNTGAVFEAAPGDIQADAIGNQPVASSDVQPGSPLDHSILINLESATSGDGPIDPEIHAAHVAFVQARAEARLASELERVRREAEEQRAAEVARLQEEAEARRRAEVAEARAAAAAEAREALSAELAAIRSDAEARLAAELSRVRAEEAQRLAEQLEEAERARDAAVEEARVAAEQASARALEAEVERVRAEADARLQQELARLRKETEQTREAHEQAQLEAKFAREAAAPATSREVVRGAPTIARAAGVAAQIGARTAIAAFRAVRVLLRWLLRGARAAVPVLRATWERLPARTVPTAAVVLLVAGAGTLVDVSSLATVVRSSARSASSAAATLVSRARQAGQAPAPSRADAGAPPADAGNEPPPEPIEAAPPHGASVRRGDPGAGPATPGMLAVFSRVPLDLYVSGRRIGTTEDGQILLPPGRYRVGLVNARLNYRGEVTLVVRSAEVTAHTVRLPDGHVQVNTEPGAEVWIEGQHAGVAPLGALPVPLGSREIVVRHPDLGERREFVDVRYGEIAEVIIRRREHVDPPAAYPLPRLSQPGPRIR